MPNRKPFPFRFGVQSRSAGPRQPWLETVRRIEALGYDSISWPDHFVRGFEPVAAMAAAAIATERLRLSGFLFDNDFRHPVVLAMSAGSIDVLSNGRLELGIGAGWLKDEYDQSGIPFDPASVRIARLEEAVHLLKLLLSGQRTTFSGEFYIVGITTRALPDGSKDDADMTAAATERKIAWVREAAGDRFDQIELNIICPTVEITDDRRAAAERLAADLPVTADDVLESPVVLIGSVDEIAETLQERRERYGFSYIVVLEPAVEAFAPVVERLTGR